MHTKRFFSFLITLLCYISSLAQTIQVSAPQQVAVGEQFRLRYTVATQDVKGFRAGNIPDGLEVLMGPSTSSQSSFQMVNGHTSSSSSVTYTYIVSADKPGHYVVPPAHAVVNGKNVTSSAIKIVVSGQASSSSSSAHGQQQTAQVRQAGSHISGNDLFITVTANKHRVHEQEPVLLTYKVYTQVELTQLKGDMPDLKGFHTLQIPLPEQKSFHIENYRGRPYRCVTWDQYVMYPQMTGKLEIPSLTYKGIVVQANQNIDPFEAFFNGGSGYIEVKKDIIAPAVNIQVDPLPQRPEGFSGGVGKFSISGSLNKQTVAANDPVTLRVVVSGVGNLKLIKQPEVAFPKDFDKYEPKTTDKTRLSVNGLEGNMIYDFLFVPRHQGEFTIPAVEFTYYDTHANAYKTVKTKELKLHVTPGEGGNSTVADFTEKELDILAAKTGSSATTHRDIFYGTALYNAVIIAILAVFIILVFIFRQRAIMNADVVGMRGRKANKVAAKRLKLAGRLMKQHKQEQFYDEVLRALWGYVGDKLNIPVVELSRDNIRERLSARSVEADIIDVFVSAIDECEYARYAPGDAGGKMAGVYQKAMKGITEIDDFLKGSKRNRKAAGGKNNGGGDANGAAPDIMTPVFIIAVALQITCSVNVQATLVSKDTADKAYAVGNYQVAITEYEQLLKKTPSAELYYNLGNAYFRSDNITKAVIAYNKAALLLPADKEIAHNLAVARNKTIDKMQPRQQSFIVAGFDAVVRLFNTDTWAFIAIISLVTVVLATLLYLFAEAVILRQVGFYGAVIAFLIFIIGNVCAYTQYSNLNADDGAVIVKDVCHVKKTPELNAAESLTVHEGTHLRIVDDTVKGWLEVVLDDGTAGWITDDMVERIITK